MSCSCWVRPVIRGSSPLRDSSSFPGARPGGGPKPNGRRPRRPSRLRTVHDAVKDQQTPGSRDMEQARRSLHPRLPPVAGTRRGSTGNRSVRYRRSTGRPARRRCCGGPTQPSRGWAGLAVAVRECSCVGTVVALGHEHDQLGGQARGLAEARTMGMVTLFFSSCSSRSSRPSPPAPSPTRRSFARPGCSCSCCSCQPSWAFPYGDADHNARRLAMADLHRRRPVDRRAAEIRKAVLRRAAARP